MMTTSDLNHWSMSVLLLPRSTLPATLPTLDFLFCRLNDLSDDAAAACGVCDPCVTHGIVAPMMWLQEGRALQLQLELLPPPLLHTTLTLAPAPSASTSLM
jgi:hypothetical protein